MPMFKTSVKRSPVAPREPAAVDGRAERLHPLLHRVDIGGSVLAISRAEAGRARGAQRHVQHGAALGRVHRLARRHGGALAFEIGGAGEVEQGGQRLVGDRGLGEVEQQPARAAGEAVEARRVGREERADGVGRAAVGARPRRQAGDRRPGFVQSPLRHATRPPSCVPRCGPPYTPEPRPRCVSSAASAASRFGAISP